MIKLITFLKKKIVAVFNQERHYNNHFDFKKISMRKYDLIKVNLQHEQGTMSCRRGN